MADVGFYHLTRTSSLAALPRLLARALQAGERAVVLLGNAARRGDLDAALWADPSWLPHNGPADEDSDLQPIWLTGRDAAPPNGSRFLFLLDSAESARLHEYQRVFDLFDGGDQAATAAARTRFVKARAVGHHLTYWRQTERGWEKG